MSYYYELRGWLESSQSDFPMIRQKLIAMQKEYADHYPYGLYIKGWCWIDEDINHIHYALYGASVQQSGLDLLETVLNAVTGLKCHVYGYFHAQGDDMARSYAYKVANDTWSVEESSPLVDWNNLDEDT